MTEARANSPSDTHLALALYANLALIGSLYALSCWPPAGPSLSIAARILWVPIPGLWLFVVRYRTRQGHIFGAGVNLRRSSRSKASGSRDGTATRAPRRRALGVSSPKWVQAIGLLSLVSGLGSLWISPGAPTEIDGQYFIANKSTVVPITESAYLVASGWQARAFLSIGAFFTVLILYYLQDDRPPLPGSMRASPSEPYE